MAVCSCYLHNGLSGCNSHNATSGCNSHSTTCSAYANDIPGVTVTFTNVTVSPGEVIDAENEIAQLLSKLNIEAIRASKSQSSLTLTNPIHAIGEIRTLRDHHNAVCNKTSVSPFSNTQIVNSQVMLASTIEAMKDNLVAAAAICLCQCNYACTCQCNYACTCQCNYACTCNCNHACICQCNYSDITLKTNIIYI